MGIEWKGVEPMNDQSFIGQESEKWLMPKCMFNQTVYPPFMAGPGYVLTREAAECIDEVSLHKKSIYE